MINIREKYRNLFADVKADAAKNMEEATAHLEQCRANETACSEQLRSLKNTADTAHSAFFDVIKALGKMAFARTPNPEDVAKSLEPCQTYIAAAAQIPAAKEDLENAEAALDTAMDDVVLSTEMLEKLTYFS